MNKLEIFNQSLFLQINADAGTHKWAIDAAIIIANDLLYLMLGILLAGWMWGETTKRNLIVKACLVVILGTSINLMIGLFYWHPRPFMIGLGHMWMPHAADSSFPSDHLVVFAGLGLTLMFDGELRIGIITLLTGLSVAWARIYLGGHFPLDMVGAIGVAGLSYIGMSLLWGKTGKRITELIERAYRKTLARPIMNGWIRN